MGARTVGPKPSEPAARPDRPTEPADRAVAALAGPAAGPVPRSAGPPDGHRPMSRAPGASALSVQVWGAALMLVAGMAVAFGVVLRTWLITHMALFGDDAVVGLQARQIDDGHLTAFYWGQHYGGLEPYVAALLQAVHHGPVSLDLTPALLGAVAAVVVGVVVVTAGVARWMGVVAGSVTWVWSYACVWNSVREGGFRAATLCCGLIAVLAAVRAVRGRAGRATFVVLGLAAGLGWWASPESCYFAVPCLVLLAAWWRQGPTVPPRPRRRLAVLLAAGGAVVGSAPWWYANLTTGFASIRSSAAPSTGGVGFGDRLIAFFSDTLPIQLGVRTVPGGVWVGGPVVGPVLFALLLIALGAALFWALARTRSPYSVALALAVLAFPFLYALVPSSGYWADGRFGIYLPPLLVLLGAAVALPVTRPGGGEPSRAAAAGRRLSLVAALGVVAAAVALTAAAAEVGGVPLAPGALLSAGSNPDAAMLAVIDQMVAHHLTDAYGGYWVAYDLDFVSDGRVVVSPPPNQFNRSVALARQVTGSRDPAWLFFAPGQLGPASGTFANPTPGPEPFNEQSFEAFLQSRGVTYRVVHLGVLDAVVPARPVAGP